MLTKSQQELVTRIEKLERLAVVIGYFVWICKEHGVIFEFPLGARGQSITDLNLAMQEIDNLMEELKADKVKT